MYYFGKSSTSRREGLCPELKQVADSAIQILDHSIICSIRPKEEQNEAFKKGYSGIRWPHSKHNITDDRPLSDAIDVWPYISGMGAISGNELQIKKFMLEYHLSRAQVESFVYKAFARLAGVYQACAHNLGYKTIWGGDWNDNGNLLDQKFHDLPHVELIR